MFNAGHLISNTDQSSESWPLAHLATELARASKKYKSAIDLMYAYGHATLFHEAIKVIGFFSGGNLFAQ